MVATSKLGPAGACACAPAMAARQISPTNTNLVGMRSLLCHRIARAWKESSTTRGNGSARTEHLCQLVRRRDLELVVAALGRTLVGAPAQERGGVAEAIAQQVVVLHLADALDAQRLPRQVLSGAPAAVSAGHPLSSAFRLRPLTPRVRGHRAWYARRSRCCSLPGIRRERSLTTASSTAGWCSCRSPLRPMAWPTRFVTSSIGRHGQRRRTPPTGRPPPHDDGAG